MFSQLLTSLPQFFGGAPSQAPLLDRIRQEASLLHGIAADQLRRTTAHLRSLSVINVAGGDTLLAPAFAAVCEAIRRELGFELFDVQLSAGLAMARGEIAEMQTGEGKTLAAALAAFSGAVTQGQVHVVTPNHYLATRDFELLSPVYRALGCSVGLLPENRSLPEKKPHYACDILYGTGYEFGFDYLREQLILQNRRTARLGDRCRRLLEANPDCDAIKIDRAVAIVDEIDSVLIDEASTPLILSDARSREPEDIGIYKAALSLAASLTANQDFIAERDGRGYLELTEDGRLRCHSCTPQRLLDSSPAPWLQLVQQALQALHGLRRDIDYVVVDGKAVIVDAATGRLCPDRAWRNGLQQLLETKEGLAVTQVRRTAARITRQRYFRLYRQLCGMTGTAAESASEFRKVYGLDVMRIPTRLPSRRTVLPDRVFTDSKSRLRAVVAETVRVHKTGRPLLIGCRTISSSENLARRLAEHRVDFQLLNAKQDAAEADVIARAGRKAAITIATNMAGRGTDIKLGAEVAALGGMHLIAVERNASPRVDRQLAGRVARQGDPGSAQFFLSGDDELLLRFAPDLCRRLNRVEQAEGEIALDLSAEIRAAQSRSERASYRLRLELAAADDWLCNELGKQLR